MAKQTTGEFLATLRKANGLTQQAVAEKLSISDRTLSSWETGRTAPDILILPAIADLYGVTVDEILRGERRQADKPEEKENELSDKAQRALRKSRYAKFNGRRFMLLGFSLLGALLFLAGCACLLYSSAPLWLDIILMILGAGGNIACIILLPCFEYVTLKNEGLVLEEDYDEQKSAFALTLKHGVVSALKINSLPYILGAIIFLSVFFACGFGNYWIEAGGIRVQINQTPLTIVSVSLSAVFGLALLIAGQICDVKAMNKLGTEKQKSARTRNGSLVLKLCAFGAIPVFVIILVTAILNSVFFFDLCYTRVDEVYYRTSDENELLKAFHTLTVEEDKVLSNLVVYGKTTTVPKGEYLLNITDTPEYIGGRQVYDLGNGFYGIRRYNGDEGYGWDIYYFDGTADNDGEEADFFDRNYTYFNGTFKEDYYWAGGESKTIVNVGLQEHTDGVLVSDVSKGEYTFEAHTVIDLKPILFGIGGGVTAATVITCTAVYLSKRKRIIYTF